MKYSPERREAILRKLLPPNNRPVAEVEEEGISDATIRGQLFYLYFMPDIYSRKIVGTEVFDAESAISSEIVLHKMLLREGCINNPPMVHFDNGSAMKGGTLLATFEKLGVPRSYSRPRMSNDKSYIESLFGGTKQRPEHPPAGFDKLGLARDWVTAFIS